jgi:hypothetical protein
MPGRSDDFKAQQTLLLATGEHSVWLLHVLLC